MRQLTRDEVTFTVELEPENTSIRGNVMASGDDEADLAAEKNILERLWRDDYSAWCVIVVKAEWKDFKGMASMGCVSLAETNTGPECTELAEGFAKDNDMYNQALEDLNQSIANYVQQAKDLQKELG